MEAMGAMRDLDQIRERDESSESSKIALIALGGLATACVLFAVGVMIGRDGDSARPGRREDPLARLDALAGQPAAQTAQRDSTNYTDRLVDPPAAAQGAEPAVNGGTAAHGLTDTAADPSAATVPAAALVETNGRVRDSVPSAARVATPPSIRIAPAAAAPSSPAPAGSDGTFTLQVSSFRALAGAQSFAQRLRDRGHRAFVTTGPSGLNGIWHRVRIGPFHSLSEAGRYREQFEARERLPTFVVRRDDAAHS